MSAIPPVRESRPSLFFFLKQYLLKPSGIGAIAPSSKNLARLIARNINLQPDDVVVELGAGTGVFTRQLLACGVRPGNLIVVESNPAFVTFLKKEFPGLRIVAGDARELRQVLHSLGLDRVEKIVSGIPMRSINPVDRVRIAAAMAAALKPGGILVQFSYFNSPPLPQQVAAESGLTGRRADIAIGNLPPAYVWQYRKAYEAGGNGASAS